MPNRTDEAKLRHFAGVLGWERRKGVGRLACLTGWYEPGTTVELYPCGPHRRGLPDFRLDKTALHWTLDGLDRVCDEYAIGKTGGAYIATASPGVYRKGVNGKTLQSAAFALVLAVTGYKNE